MTPVKGNRVDRVCSHHILILAAGLSSRMRGTDKLLLQIDGTPQITRIAQAALATQSPVHVVLGPGQAARRQVLGNLPVNVITAPLAAHGMSESLKAGLAAIPPEAAVLLLLADLPEIGTAEIEAMLAAHLADPAMILRGATGTKPGHPVLLPRWVRHELTELQGDKGACEFLERYLEHVKLVSLAGNAATRDIDTPENWSSWLAHRKRYGMTLCGEA